MKVGKKIGKSILAWVLVTAMAVPAAISAKAASTPITMKYDDYYEIASGTVQVPTNNVVEWSESTRKLHAIGVGETTITVNGTATTVTVSKAKLNVVLVTGQSNANGINGIIESGITPITPDKGYGYYWHIDQTAREWVDMKTAVDAAVAADPSVSVGFYPALAKEWYDLTGEKTAVIKNAYGGNPLRNWVNMTTGQFESNATNTLSYIQEALGEIDTSKFEIVRTGYYWLQGESDTFIYTHRENDQYITTEQYMTAYMKIHDAYTDALTVDGINAPVGGILSCRTMRYEDHPYKNLELASPRVAHQELANTHEDIFMASVITEDWNKEGKAVNFVSRTNISISGTTATVGANDIHYTQRGYNILGLDAADNMYKALVEKPAISGIEIIGQDGYSKYSNGDEINVNDNLRPVGDYNTCDKDKAQILVRPIPISAKCSEVTLTVKDSSGNPVNNVMNNNGYIDVTKVTDPLTFTASAGNVENTYALTKSDITNVISFDGNGGTGSMDAKRVSSGREYTLPSCNFTAPANKAFKCWNVNGVEKLAGEKVLISEDTTLVAVWQSLPEEKLKVIAQSTQAPVASGEYQGQYVLRFTSTVEMDYDKYDYVGFELTYDDNGTTQKYEATTQSIFKRIKTTTEGAELELSPKAVDVDSEYFFTAKWPVSTNDVKKEYIVKAFFVLKGSTEKVYGPSRIVSVEAGLTSSDYAYVTFPLAEGVAAPAIGDVLTAGTTNATVVAVKDGYVHTTVAKAGLKAVTNFTFTKGGATLGTVLHRYYQTTVTNDTSWYDVNPNASKFAIASLEELYGFATLRTDFAGKIVYLACDIQMNSGNATDWAAGTTTGVRTWTPIHKKTASGGDAWTGDGWKGTFDGQGHTISGMYVPRADTYPYSGLFYTADKEATIQNLKVVNSYVTGSYAGTVAATGAANLKNIYSNAIIHSSDRGGGLLGERNIVPRANVIENCWFDGTVKVAGGFAGGIVGITYNNYDGGYINIKDSLVTGTVNGNTNVGGIAGRIEYGTLALERCIVASSEITGGTAMGTMLGAILNSNDALKTTSCFGFGTVCSSVAFSTGYRQVTDTQLTGTKAYNLMSDNFDLYKVTNEDAVWTLTDGYPAISYWTDIKNRIDATGIVIEEDPEPSSDPMAWYNNDSDKAGGTGNGEFTIRTAEEFYAFSEISQSYNFVGKTVKLANDIVLNEGNATDWAQGKNTDNLITWTSIANGQWGAGFAGTFDGQGHTISGMYNPSGTEDGLFESVSKTGCIKNLKLTNSYIKSTWTGSVVARLSGNMENVYSDAIVVGKDSTAAGGIVGEFNENSYGVTASMKNCWFAGSVSNSGVLGGIAGQMYGKYIASGSTDSYSMSDCIVTGSVTGTAEKTGGLIGDVVRGVISIERCFSLCSSLSAGSNTAGALVGSYTATTTRRVAGNYGLTAPAFGNGKYTGGYTQCLQAQLTGNDAYEWMLGHDLYSASNPDGIWTLTNGYPGLSYWVNANDKVNADILVKAGNNLKNLKISFFGDSLTRGDTGQPYAGAANGYTDQHYPYWVGQNLSVTVDNTGVPGHKATQMWNIVSQYDFSNTDIAIFMIGANGGVRDDFDTNYTNTATEIGALYASVKKALDDTNGNCKILIIHTLDYKGIDWLLEATRANMNRIAEEFNLPTLDLYNQYPYAYDNATYYNSYDLTHLTPAGYKVMGNIVSNYIKYIWAE